MFSAKNRSRRAEIRKNRPDALWVDWEKLKEQGVPASLGIAAVFFVAAAAILMLRQDVVPYRLGQWLNHDIVSRVRFTYTDPDRLDEKRREATLRVPRMYSPAGEDVWEDVEKALLQLPERVSSSPQLPADLKSLDSGSATLLRKYASPESRKEYTQHVERYVQTLRDFRITAGGQPFPICILPDADRAEDVRFHKPVNIAGVGVIDAARTFTTTSDELRTILNDAARQEFLLALQPRIVDLTIANLHPTQKLDEAATTEAQERARDEVSPAEAEVRYAPDQPLVFKSEKVNKALDQQGWLLLRAEHQAYLKSLRHYRWMSRLGVAQIVLAITVLLAAYIAFYQPKIVRNHTRQAAIAGLLLAMLLLNQIAAIGNGPTYLFGVAPTLLVAMILAIAYDQRTAMGIGSMHALLATLALNQSISFFVVVWVGVLTVCFLLDDIRTRSKLVEVGGATALAMAGAACAAGLLAFDPWFGIWQNCLYAGAAGLAVGFVVLGILPFIEKAFKITTSMTLLEMADVSQPLLRRLAVEAPGTYNHSLQVATIAEAAAEAIEANALLCRVASYYHDIGKINKADYFCENQGPGENRHLNLSPNVSLLIIIGHVKDGVELAREYNVPASIIPFIQQHHGTTLVEFFYHQACTQQEQRQPEMPAVSDTQYRYPGPKPKTREIAVVMLADAVESATRAMMSTDPTVSRIEGLVHDLAMKRLLDGQFDECDLTMRELEQIERSMLKTVMGIYHGRIAYPSNATVGVATAEPVAVRSA